MSASAIVNGIGSWYSSTVHLLRRSLLEKKQAVGYLRSSEMFGVNLFGYFDHIFGIAESGRAYYNALRLSGLPFCLMPIQSNIHEQMPHGLIKSPIRRYYSRENLYPVNLIVANADQMKKLYSTYGARSFKDRYNIGMWAWEIEDYFPFNESLKYVDEVWSYSSFMCDIYRKYIAKPVVKITYPFQATWGQLTPEIKVRNRYGISKNTLLFFYNFDFFSSYERKNPEGVIDAFQNAFGDRKYNAKIIIKTIHESSHRADLEKLRKKIGRDDRIIWARGPMNKDGLMSLINASDCYISLHRSEGLGLGLIEAMYLGKCVIGTAYSGNMEFMDKENSILIPCSKAPIKEDHGPYKKGKTWAEPDIGVAADRMKQLYDDADIIKKIGNRAAHDIRTKLDPEKTVSEMVARFAEIRDGAPGHRGKKWLISH